MEAFPTAPVVSAAVVAAAFTALVDAGAVFVGVSDAAAVVISVAAAVVVASGEAAAPAPAVPASVMLLLHLGL